MSDTTMLPLPSRSALRSGLIRAAVALLALAIVGGLLALSAQMGAPAEPPPTARHPFATGVTEAAPSPTGIGGAILAIQSAFYARMIAALQAFSADPAAAWTLVALSFAYGVFHAAGPGHGKAVIAGYLVADGRRSIGRGLALALASSLLQAVSAIVIVGVLAVTLNATAAAVNATARVIEQVSFGLVALVGLIMLWRKAGRLTALLRPARMAGGQAAPGGDGPLAGLAFQPPASAPAGRASAFGVSATGVAGSRFRAEAVDARDAPANCDDPACAAGLCGHAHLLSPAEVGRVHSLRDMAMVTLSAGLRPCTGAIVVLVFAVAQGMTAGGIAATFAMALGTFITVGALASLAVFAKRLAAGLAAGMTGENGRNGARAIAALEVLASAVVATIGAVLVLG